MKNFKVTFKLGEQGVILNRFTTLDSILLATYYNIKKMQGQEITEIDYTHSTVDFIKRENGTFSGSMWYVPEENPIFFDNKHIIKFIDDTVLKYIKSDSIPDSGMYKQQLLQEEILLTESVYFYITMEEKKLRQILSFIQGSSDNNIQSGDGIGKKRNLGYGQVSDIIIEEIDEEKGFMLDKSNPSKPLPKEFDIDSNKIALWRRMAPYYSNKDLEPCYMPTTSLIEVEAKQRKSFKSSTKIVNPITMTKRLYVPTKKQPDDYIYKLKSVKSILSKKKNPGVKVTNNTTLVCALTNEIEDCGIELNVRDFFNIHARTFVDLNYINFDAEFISETGLWLLASLIDLKNIAVVTQKSIINYKIKAQIPKDNNKFKNIETNVIGQILTSKLSILKPPFIHQLAVNKKNPVHLVFKNRLSISQGFFYVQYTNRRLEIDGALLLEAYDEMLSYLKSKNPVSKSVLLGDHKYHIKKTADTEENRKFMMDFRRKYNKDILIYLQQLTGASISEIDNGVVYDSNTII